MWAFKDHVWYIYLHLAEFFGKCREIYHTWMLWKFLPPQTFHCAYSRDCPWSFLVFENPGSPEKYTGEKFLGPTPKTNRRPHKNPDFRAPHRFKAPQHNTTKHQLLGWIGNHLPFKMVKAEPKKNPSKNSPITPSISWVGHPPNHKKLGHILDSKCCLSVCVGWWHEIEWLVVEPTHLKKKIVKMGDLPQIGEHKHYFKPPAIVECLKSWCETSATSRKHTKKPLMRGELLGDVVSETLTKKVARSTVDTRHDWRSVPFFRPMPREKTTSTTEHRSGRR